MNWVLKMIRLKNVASSLEVFINCNYHNDIVLITLNPAYFDEKHSKKELGKRFGTFAKIFSDLSSMTSQLTKSDDFVVCIYFLDQCHYSLHVINLFIVIDVQSCEIN
jgi:hypothetical protein